VVTSFRRGLLLIVLAAALWGTTGLTSKSLDRLSAVDPLSVGFLRLAIAAPAMLVIGHWSQTPGSLAIVLRREWLALCILGLAMAGYNACFFAGIARTSVTAATLLAISTAPLFVAMLASVFLKETLTRSILLALAAGLIGAILLVVGQSGHDPSTPLRAGPSAGLALFQREHALGNLLALGAGLAYAVYALVGRLTAQRASGLSQTAALGPLSFTLAAVFLAPLALYNSLSLPTSLPAWLAVLYLGLIPTALAYFLYFFGLRVVPATVASISTLVEPLTAALLAALFLGERLTPGGLIGAALLLSSLVILSVGDLATRRKFYEL
jgi:DME family drug/metabolite transporter